MASGKDSGSFPPFLRLAGHELRWQLMHELARSDLRVRELVSRLGEPQNLLSYHLGKLRSAGLVTMRRSSADGRDNYYHLDLATCAELLTEMAAALHPSLTGADPVTGNASARRAQVLFLCTGNSARSPMAAALLRRRTSGSVKAVSAGSNPKPLNPFAVRVMTDFGIDLSGHRPKRVDAYLDRRFDFVISLCDRVREVCPPFPGRPAYVHWSIPDPASSGGGRSAAPYRSTAEELDTRIRFLIPTLVPR